MRLDIRRYLTAVLLGGALCWSAARLQAYEPEEARAIFLLGDGLEFQHDQIRLMTMQEESTQPLDLGSTQPFDPGSTQPFDSGNALSPDLGFPNFSTLDSLLQNRSTAPGVEGVVGEEIRTSISSDLGSLLQDSDNVQTIGAQRRSQVAFDPRIRGYHYGQIYAQAEGQHFLPVRLDLDSMLNKIDPNLVNSVTVIPGPYGAMYGPGFAFINVDLVDTPRYFNCPETHGRIWADFRSNGGQTAEQITSYGGGSDYGYIIHYGHRKGSNYVAGNGQSISSSYQTQNLNMQFGFDWSPDNTTEIRYNHLNMGPTEYALQFFDISALQTHALNVKNVTTDPCDGSLWVNQLWTNNTDFHGDNQNTGKADVRNRIAGGLNQEIFDNGSPTGVPPGTDPGFTGDFITARVRGNLGTHGLRSEKIWGDDTTNKMRAGADMRFTSQSTQENFILTDQPGDFLLPQDQVFQTNQPQSSMIDPGLFTELSSPWTSYLRVTAGARLDWVRTYRDANFVKQNGPVIGDLDNQQNDSLAAAYLVGDVDLSCNWKARVGAGYAERVPDLVNRYADGVYISMLQSGFSRIIGDSRLQKEQVMQCDASLRGNFDYGNVRASAFYSWIHDYNTYAAIGVENLTGANLLVATNTPLATLQGFEFYSDYQAADTVTLFATLQYVEGTDQSLGRPLPGIYPLESRLGMRVVDDMDGNTWGWEWGWRLVDAQNRVGFYRDNFVGLPGEVQVESPTGGFATSYLKGYYNYSQNVHFIGGIDNLFNRNYLEHLDLRLNASPGPAAGGTFPPIAAFSPGFTAYSGVEFLW